MRHEVSLLKGGHFEKIFGAKKIVTNSLHGQGIKRAGERIIIEGHATDGTPEAIKNKRCIKFCICCSMAS